MTSPLRRALALACTAAVCLTSMSSRAQGLSVVEILDSYKAGKFAAVVAELEGDIDFKEVLKQLQDQGPAWIDAGGPDERDRRELVAATFALEAARAGEWREWKFIWKQPPLCPPPPPDGSPPSKAGCVSASERPRMEGAAAADRVGLPPHAKGRSPEANRTLVAARRARRGAAL